MTAVGYLGLLVPVDGPVRDVVVTDGGDDGLASMRELIGCDYVEHVRGPGCALWVDEEGAVCQPPRLPNPRIDALLRRSDGWSIRGDVLITGEVGLEGETRSLPTVVAAELITQLSASGGASS